jgi:telomere length regulation protein
VHFADPASSSPHREREDSDDEDDTADSSKPCQSTQRKDINGNNEEEELKPFAMPAETDDTAVAAKTPKYLRECIAGLRKRDDADTFEACVKTAGPLIRRRPDDLGDVAAELMVVLLNTHNEYSMDGFDAQRLDAMVSLVVECPEVCAACLCDEFYDRNSGLRQRLDSLEVVALAAEALAQQVSSSPRSSKNQQELLPELTAAQKQQREALERKTRRFTSGTTRLPAPAPTRNAFAAVASSFFYPLLSKLDTASGEAIRREPVVLGQLLRTLTVIVNSLAALPPRQVHPARRLLCSCRPGAHGAVW